MRLYLAGAWNRRAEIQGYARELRGIGLVVTSRWLNEGITEEGDDGNTREEKALYASIDLLDIEYADGLVLFTDPRGSANHTGGRHFEAGYAMARRRKIYVVGPEENIFYCLSGVRRFENFKGLRKHLATIAEYVNP